MNRSEYTIGNIIGIVEHTFSTKGTDGVSAKTTIKFDFSSSNNGDIVDWVIGNRSIAMQRPLSKLTAQGIIDTKGRVVEASKCGQTLPDRDKAIAETAAMFMKAGIDEIQALELATKAVDNPSAVTKAMDDSESDLD